MSAGCGPTTMLFLRSTGTDQRLPDPRWQPHPSAATDNFRARGCRAAELRPNSDLTVQIRGGTSATGRLQRSTSGGCPVRREFGPG
jgi:hypothetical protein